MKVKTWWVALLCGTVLALPVAAQDDPVPAEPPPETKVEITETARPSKSLEDPPLHRWGGWTLSVTGWHPTLIGADEEVATQFSGGVASPVVQGGESTIAETARVTFHLPRGFGSIVGQYDGLSQDDLVKNFTPGQFNFAETRAYPLLLGAFDDGLADGVVSRAARTTREFRLEFQKRAFESRWARATWSVGYRQLSHQSHVGVAYFAIVPNLPPVVPPVVGENVDPLRLQPIPDVVDQMSRFSGNGLGASFDVEFTVHPRVSIVSGVSIGLVRGTSISSYSSTSSFYYLTGTPNVPMTKDELFALLSNPPPETSPPDPPAVSIADIEQGSVVVGLKGSSSSQLAQSYDVYVGVQVLLYKGLRMFGTLRDVSHTNVGQYVVPRPGPSNEKTSLNAAYEGVGVGLSWRF